MDVPVDKASNNAKFVCKIHISSVDIIKKVHYRANITKCLFYMRPFLLICFRYPIWIYHSPKYDLYGMPMHGNSGSKIGIDAGGPVVTVETRTYEPDKAREQACIDHLKKTVPRVYYAFICYCI